MLATLFRALESAARGMKHELAVYRLVRTDPRTPLVAKILLGLAIGYTLLPFDLIPDFLPLIGHVDDLVFVPALIVLALRCIPPSVLADCRRRASSLGGEKGDIP